MIISTDNSVMRYAFGDKESIRMCKEAGFDGIDYSLFKMKPDNDILNLPDGERQACAYELRNYAEKIGISFPQAHADFELKYGEGKDHIHYHNLLRSLEFASWMGIKQIVVHTVKNGIPEDEDFDVLAYNRPFFSELIPIAEKLDLKIGMENLFRKKPNGNFNYVGVLGTAEEMNAYRDSFDTDVFVTCVDIGHAAIVGVDPAEFIRGMSKDKLTMLHVQDTDFKSDKHWLPYMGKHDWDSITSALAEIGFDSNFNLEVLHFYDRFKDHDLMQSSLCHAAKVARFLADEVEAKKAALSK
ncbi:MAG: sugar phosphate isomerase/epimerase [Clostridia bacterium]|nr:sugar phosphate isomerase/epimerase [Clostridia bacterium]